ncbi:Ter macrodomain-binding protein MatP [Photobacterium phosphoreum]|uniref:Ter macrodomain-binding protein MatP n=1 Tax=Photobacterium phosphoreum TaxID=659 RepID=A0A2T3JTH6_PHOPO|nr:Ter macrodomain-binding protein MatP [Photobacterium phosphoreum]PSU38601.1 Ter macrodomain-binding protein MatP [Photobacterium phosphoreum]PSU52473.1 Ter macrodomain-binding protein MatP [Photobacterium phosphoreum]
MKYQQLDNLESGWKWQYLNKKFLAGENASRWIDTSEIQQAKDDLTAIGAEPTKITNWIEKHISDNANNKLKQSIRAKRKRYFDSEQKHTKKKSIDIEYEVWEKLSTFSKEIGGTLSESIEYLLSELDINNS